MVNSIATNASFVLDIYTHVNDAVNGDDDSSSGNDMISGSEPSIQGMVHSSFDLPVNRPLVADKLVFKTLQFREKYN